MSTSRAERLEGAAIRLLWEAVVETKRLVMVRSTDPESAALVQLARHAFYPASPPFPIVDRDGLAAAKRGFDLVIDAERGTGADNQAAPIWHLGHETKRRGKAMRLFPLAGWSETDVREYLAGAGSEDAGVAHPIVARVARPALRFHLCGAAGSGKTSLTALLSRTTRTARAPEQHPFIIDDVPGQDGDPRGVLTAASI